jgi:single-strand DNA-binding protein
MLNINKVTLLGYVGADPDVREMPNGSVCNLRIATSDRYKDRNGEMQETTEWHTVSIWIPSMIELCQKYVRKGSKLYLEGKLHTRKWQDKQGNDRWTTGIQVRPFSGLMILLDDKFTDSAPPKRSGPGLREPVSITDDDIPF